MILWSFADGQLKLPKDAAQALAALPSVAVCTFLGATAGAQEQGVACSVARANDKDVVGIDLRPRWPALARNPTLSQELLASLLFSSTVCVTSPVDAGAEILQHFTFLRTLTEQFGGPQNVKAKLPLKLVVCWVDESGKELSAKRAQNVTTKWLAAETGFSEEIAERNQMRQLITECFAVVAGVPIDTALMQTYHADLAAFISSPAVSVPLLDTVEGSARLAKRVVLSGKLLNKGIPKALEAGQRGEAVEPKEMWKQAVQTHLQELATEASQEYRSRVADLTRDLAGESKAAELIPYEQLLQVHQEAREASLRVLTSQINRWDEVTVAAKKSAQTKIRNKWNEIHNLWKMAYVRQCRAILTAIATSQGIQNIVVEELQDEEDADGDMARMSVVAVDTEEPEAILANLRSGESSSAFSKLLAFKQKLQRIAADYHNAAPSHPVVEAAKDEPLMYFLQHQIADEMLTKAIQWVKAFGKARTRADRAIQRLEGKLQTARAEEKEMDERTARVTEEWEAKIKVAVDELAAQRSRQANVDEGLQSQLDGLSQRLERRTKQQQEDRHELEQRITGLATSIQEEQEKMDKLQQARETKMKTVARELIENERSTKANQEEVFTTRAQLTDEQLALERELNTITNNQMKKTFAIETEHIKKLEELRREHEEKIRKMKEAQWEALKGARLLSDEKQRKVRRELIEVETRLMALEENSSDAGAGDQRNSGSEKNCIIA